MMPRRGVRWWLLVLPVVAFVTGCLVVLRHWIPTFVAMRRPHDELLFLLSADSITRGEWLGAADPIRLSKGPVFALLIAPLLAWELPVSTVLFVLYVLAAALLSVAVGLILTSRGTAVVAFLLLVMSPVSFAANGSKLLRENLYVSEAMAVTALSLLAVWLARSIQIHRVEGTTAKGARTALVAMLAIVGFLVGLVAAAFWLTREEQPWLLSLLVPAVLVAGHYWLGQGRRVVEHPSQGAAKTAAVALAVALVLAVVGFVIPRQAVLQLNEERYGVRVTNDIGEGAYPALISQLMAIDVGTEFDSSVPIPAAARHNAYGVSSAMRQLAPHLESGGWYVISCIISDVCEDLSAGYIGWAVRDAVSLAGHWGSERDAQDFMTRATDELRAACQDGRLQCTRRLGTSTIAPELGDLPDVARSFGTELAGLALLMPATDEVMGELSDDTLSSSFPLQRWDLWRKVVVPSGLTAAQYRENREAVAQQILPFMAVLRLLYLFLTIGSLALFARYLFGRLRRTRAPMPRVSLLLLIGFAVIVGSRSLLLAVVDAVAYPSVGLSYSIPSVPFFIVLMVVLARASLGDRRVEGHPQAEERRSQA